MDAKTKTGFQTVALKSSIVWLVLSDSILNLAVSAI